MAWTTGNGIGPEGGSTSHSESGAQFLPWQEPLIQKAADQYSKMLDLQMSLMSSLGGKLANYDPSAPLGGVGGAGGSLPGGGDFASYFGNISGGMPNIDFGSMPIEDVITPGMLNEQMNNLFANGQAGAGASALGLFSARPGMAASPERAGQNAALLDIGTRAGIAREYANKIPSLMFQNQEQKQNAFALNTNARNSALNQALQQAAIAGTWRGQDIQNQLGQGNLAVTREGNLLHSLSNFGSGGGGSFGGGFLNPIPYSVSDSRSQGPTQKPSIFEVAKTNYRGF